MLEIQNLCFSYGRQSVLRGVNLYAEAGELVFLLGGNGAGKTTLFKCVLGLLPKYSGNISVAGKDISTMSVREQARTLAYIPQSHSNVFRYSVLDMVLMGANHRVGIFSAPGRAEHTLAMQAMEQVGIAELSARSYHQLSGGEQQLVLVARALAQQTRVLLMDEPTACLDYGNQLKVLDKVTALAEQGYTVLLSCHNPQQALLYAKRVIALHDGIIAADGAPNEVLNETLLQKLYGVSTDFVHTQRGTLIVPHGNAETTG